jgi:ribosomal protein S9
MQMEQQRVCPMVFPISENHFYPTSDPRMRELKKPGRPGARFQFSKR